MLSSRTERGFEREIDLLPSSDEPGVVREEGRRHSGAKTC